MLLDLLGLIDRLLDGVYANPTYRVKSEVFIQRSYARWALLEFKHYIYNKIRNKDLVLGALGEIGAFRKKMGDYACDDKECSIIFSIAEDTMTDLMDQYILLKERGCDRNDLYRMR